MRKKRRSKIELFKPGIIIMVIITGLAGYLLGYRPEVDFSYWQVILFLLGLSLVSAGSFALNQAQESVVDSAMPRTQGRPIPSGQISLGSAYFLGFFGLLFGVFILAYQFWLAGLLALLTAIMYNIMYTWWLKPRSAFAAVPGAIPGAMPVVIGYSASHGTVWTLECLYIFLVMFIWQMPHFWALAIRFQNDYKMGGIPVLPIRVGVERTLFHIGLYVFVYVALVLGSPWFVNVSSLYFWIIVPFCLKILWEFYRYRKSNGELGWLRFFMWVNVSLLVFLAVPVFDKWGLLVLSYMHE